jgi:hypothetical protein
MGGGGGNRRKRVQVRYCRVISKDDKKGYGAKKMVDTMEKSYL